MLPSHKKINEQFKPPIDEKFQTMDDIIKSPLKAPQKRVEKVHTKIGDLKFAFLSSY